MFASVSSRIWRGQTGDGTTRAWAVGLCLVVAFAVGVVAWTDALRGSDGV